MLRGRNRALMFMAELAVTAGLVVMGHMTTLQTKPDATPIPAKNENPAARAVGTRTASRSAAPGKTPVRQIRRVQTPLAFEPVAGPSRSATGFVARGPGYTVLVTGDEAALALKGANPEADGNNQKHGLHRGWPRVPFSLARFRMTSEGEKVGAAALPSPLFGNPRSEIRDSLTKSLGEAESSVVREPQDVIRVKFLGANPRAQVSGRELLPGKSNYFIGRDRAKWRTDVPHFAKAKVKGIYPGIDLVYYGNQGQLEYDFIVRPGADPGVIRLAVAPIYDRGTGEHSSPLQLDASGDIVISTNSGEVRLSKPVVYQASSDPGNPKSAIQNPKLLDGRFTLTSNNELAFALPAYDRKRPLVIDPVLVYSSYLGGSGYDSASAVAVDSEGNMVVAGITASVDFPTTSESYQPSANFSCSIQGCTHGFITKFDPSGASLIYSTFLGGSASDYIGSVAEDSSGNAFVGGSSSSTDFPLVNPTPTNYTSGTCGGFVGELSAAGDQLLYSSCFAQSGVSGVAVDSADNVYLAGGAGAANFPITPGAFQTTYNGVGEIFISKFQPNGSPIIASTFLGGADYVFANGMALDSAGSPYVVGLTQGATFPTTAGAFDTAPGAGCNTVIAKLKSDLSAPTYSTYLCAGDYFPAPAAISVDLSGNAYVTGLVTKPIFPATPGAFQTTLNGTDDAYLAKFDPSGSTLVYGTYIGGAGQITRYGLAVDSVGQAYVVADGGPIANPFQPSCLGQGCALVMALNSSGSAIVYATYLGGSGSQGTNGPLGDGGSGIALTPSGNVAVVGNTGSYDFPLVKPFQATYGGLEDAFLAIISPIDAPGATLRPTAVSFPNQSVGTASAAEFATLLNVGSQPLAITSIGATGDFSETNTCPSTIAVGANCSVKVTFSPTAPGDLTGALVVTDNALDSPQSFTLSGTGLGAAASAAPATIAFPNQFVGTTGLPQDVTLTNMGTIPLTITAVAATGDFAAVNGCTSSVAPGVNCTIGVFFDPSVTGNRTGTLTITDNSPDSPQSVALSGTGEDFSMALQAPAPTAPAGTEVTDPLTLSPAGGFDVPVILTCSGAPALSTCNVNPSSAAMDGTAPVTVTVTIQTTGTSGAPGRPQFPIPPLRGFERLLMPGLILALVSLTFLVTRRRRSLVVSLSLASLLLLATLWSACGGSTTVRAPRTPPGTYTLSVTGIAASGPATLSHTVPLTLKVQ